MNTDLQLSFPCFLEQCQFQTLTLHPTQPDISRINDSTDYKTTVHINMTNSKKKIEKKRKLQSESFVQS